MHGVAKSWTRLCDWTTTSLVVDCNTLRKSCTWSSALMLKMRLRFHFWLCDTPILAPHASMYMQTCTHTHIHTHRKKMIGTPRMYLTRAQQHAYAHRGPVVGRSTRAVNYRPPTMDPKGGLTETILWKCIQYAQMTCQQAISVEHSNYRHHSQSLAKLYSILSFTGCGWNWPLKNWRGHFWLTSTIW